MKIRKFNVVVYDIYTNDVAYIIDYTSENFSKCVEIANIFNDTLKKHKINNVFYGVERIGEIDYENN